MTESAEPSPPATTQRRIRRWSMALGRILVWIVVVITSIWAVLAIRYSNLSGAPPRTVLPVLFAVLLLASMFAIRPRPYRFAAVAVLLIGTMCWYFSIPASNDRDWALDNARVPRVDINGDKIIVHNVRNADWRSDSDFTPAWDDRTYNLSDLCAVDLFFCHWGSKAIAHGIVSFGFSDGRYLDVSIETRKERAEEVSALQSFFRNYDLIYVFADERDLIRVRTNVRHEDVYLYHTNLTGDEGRRLLMSYIGRANELAATPEFYNGLTSNCI